MLLPKKMISDTHVTRLIIVVIDVLGAVREASDSLVTVMSSND
jgi:hypothetical protein